MSKTTKVYVDKIASKDEKIQQLLNQKKQLIQKQKATERKERNSRLCNGTDYWKSICQTLLLFQMTSLKHLYFLLLKRKFYEQHKAEIDNYTVARSYIFDEQGLKKSLA